MKTASDPRHIFRKKIMKVLFAQSFTPQKNMPEQAKEIIGMQNDIDKKISLAAPAWPIDKINKIDLAILRLSLYELIQGTIPAKVVIDEAVELAKSYGGENSASFVNGVLGTIFQQQKNE